MDVKSADSRITRQDLGDGIVVVAIDRAEKRNALSLSMWRTLGDLFLELSGDAAVRAVILTGKGPHFCAGADISEFPSVRATAEQGLEYDRINDEATTAIFDCSVPVIAALNGFTVGGGLAIALACDFRLAHASLRTGITAGRMGLVYSPLDCSLLAMRAGTTNAREVLFTSTIYDAQEALALSLVDRVVEGDVMEAAIAFARRMSVNAPLSGAGNKAMLNALATGTVAERHDELMSHVARAFDSEDYKEGQRAFAEKRAPVFQGH